MQNNDQAARMQALWVAQGNVARMQAKLLKETDPAKRKLLEELLVAERKLVALH